MYPTLVDFGFVGIHSYGLMLATAFITSVFVIQHELKRRGFVHDVAGTIVFAAAIGGVVGAKIYAALLDGRITLAELFSTSGVVWYGGFIGGMSRCHHRRRPFAEPDTRHVRYYRSDSPARLRDWSHRLSLGWRW